MFNKKNIIHELVKYYFSPTTLKRYSIIKVIDLKSKISSCELVLLAVSSHNLE